jgi:surface antigen
MKINKGRSAVVLAVALSLSGCTGVSNQDAGVITGGVLGGVLGNSVGGGTGRVIATIGGTMLGAYIGGNIGSSMDRTDKMAMNSALERQPTNQAYSWENPDTHNHYSVRPVKTYYHHGKACRTFVTTATIGGKAETVKGRACRQNDGTWRVVQ